MADTMFRSFLVTRAETLKNELTNTELGVEDILVRAQEIVKLERRIKRIDNPISRKKRTNPETVTNSETVTNPEPE